MLVYNGYIDGLIAGLGLTILGVLGFLFLLLLLHPLNKAAAKEESQLKW